MTDIALFGVTGDLSRQKLIPSLFRLHQSGIMSKDDSVIGFGRKLFSGTDLRHFVTENASKSAYAGNDKEEQLSAFAALWTYVWSELDDESGYIKLDALLADKAVIYLSLPPDLQSMAARKLIESGTVKKGSLRRIVFEKPFGHDGASAESLQAYLRDHLDESQILRIDHYAGKQALLDLEKTAALGVLGGLLDSGKISCIDARFYETKTAEGRGAFYNGVGAVYDVGQSHLLHMLATVMGLPLVEDSIMSVQPGPAASLRLSLADARSLVLRHLELDPRKTILAQYEGFTAEQGVDPLSVTETFFAAEGRIVSSPANIKKAKGGKNHGPRNELDSAACIKLLLRRWKGVKILLSGGKALGDADTSISLKLKGSKKTVRIPVNGYGIREAHDEIFEAAIRGNLERFVDFTQIQESWRLAEEIKGAPRKTIRIYKKGITPGLRKF